MANHGRQWSWVHLIEYVEKYQIRWRFRCLRHHSGKIAARDGSGKAGTGFPGDGVAGWLTMGARAFRLNARPVMKWSFM
jgi:hypothetical protein